MKLLIILVTTFLLSALILGFGPSCMEAIRGHYCEVER